jgi:hypothetical protein
MTRKVQTYASASTAKAFEIGVRVFFRERVKQRYSLLAAIVTDAARK